jgi:pyruvate kinase
VISDHKGCNIPSGNISLNVITPKDERDLKLIAELDPEYVACSFVGTADDVKRVRQMLTEFGNPNIKIISKIERPVALGLSSPTFKLTPQKISMPLLRKLME